VLVPVLSLLLCLIFIRSSRRRRGQKPAAAVELSHWPGLDSEFYRLERKLAQRGVMRRPGEPLSLWLQRAAGEPDLAELRQPLRDLLALHYRHRFDPLGLDPAERETLRREAETCLASVERRS
jgi:hypothetical protein